MKAARNNRIYPVRPFVSIFKSRILLASDRGGKHEDSLDFLAVQELYILIKAVVIGVYTFV